MSLNIQINHKQSPYRDIYKNTNFHYCQLRMDKATQKEHRIVAEQCWEIISHHFPDVKKAIDEIASWNEFEKKLP